MPAIVVYLSDERTVWARDALAQAVSGRNDVGRIDEPIRVGIRPAVARINGFPHSASDKEDVEVIDLGVVVGITHQKSRVHTAGALHGRAVRIDEPVKRRRQAVRAYTESLDGQCLAIQCQGGCSGRTTARDRDLIVELPVGREDVSCEGDLQSQPVVRS